LFQAVFDLGILLARPGNPRKISFDVSHEYRNADLAEVFGKDPQRDSFSGACGSRDEPVTVRHSGEQYLKSISFGDGQTF
jgi:hypothetical protein